MGLGVEDRLRKLVEQMKVAGYNSHMIRLAKEIANDLQQRGICGIDSFVKNLKDRVNSKQEYQEYLDILKEGRFAIILARNGFSEVTLIRRKKEQRLPDIKADWNRNTIYFEVTRSRPSEDDQAVQDGAAFVSQDRPENIISRIQEKIRQLPKGGMNIVVIWSDTVNLLLSDITEAFKCIQQEINQNLGIYEKLSGVLFTEAGEACYPSKFELFKNNSATRLLSNSLIKKLQSLSG